MLAEKRQTDTAELKRAAVRLVTAQGDGVAEAARH
jgi:transposase-like protein